MSIKITELPELEALADADIAVSVDSSELVEANKTKRITWLNIITYIVGKLNIWKTISGDTGTTTASGYDDGLTITGTDPIDCDVTENTVTVSLDEAKFTSQTTLADTDTILMRDVNGGLGFCQITWAYIKDILKTYFDTLYSATGGQLTTAQYTMDHEMTTGEIGMSIRMNTEAANRQLTLIDPGGGATYNGAWVEVINRGTNRTTIIPPAGSGDYIHDSTAEGSIYTETEFASIRLEWYADEARWIITAATGTWTTT